MWSHLPTIARHCPSSSYAPFRLKLQVSPPGRQLSHLASPPFDDESACTETFHSIAIDEANDDGLFPMWEDMDALGRTSWVSQTDTDELDALDAPGDRQRDRSLLVIWDDEGRRASNPVSYDEARTYLAAAAAAAAAAKLDLPPRPSIPSTPPTIAPSIRSTSLSHQFPLCPSPPSSSSRPQPAGVSAIELTTTAALPPARLLSNVKAKLNSRITPFVPAPAPPSTPLQPHHFPLVSRYDWRLSSPLALPRSSPNVPPSLDWARTGAHVKTGPNRLVGIGLDPSQEGARWRGTQDEKWGWKVPVPKGEATAWRSADAYRIRPDRLIALSRKADEQQYLASLLLLGTPERREALGRCITHATGKWTIEPATSQVVPGGGSAPKRGSDAVVAIWKRNGEERIDPADYPAFVPGTVLRFTPHGSPSTSSRPERSSSEITSPKQGFLLEFKDGALVVGFDAAMQWPIAHGEHYRIDVGLDDTAYALQERALADLYLDPTHQRKRNASHVLAAQHAFVSGTMPVLREWTLQGTSLRELLVPDLDSRTTPTLPQSPSKLDDTSPTAEVARLPPPVAFLGELSRNPPPLESETNAAPSMFRDNQLINSWILRHRRKPPLQVPGDPAMKLNSSQKEAVAMALSERLSLIQGPPGTGKSQTIVSIISLLKSHFRIPAPILLAAPTHVSTDHLLSLVVQSGLNPVRLGRSERVREDLRPWTVEKRRESHPMWHRLEEARIHCEACRVEWVEQRDRTGGSKASKLEATQTDKNQELHDAYRAAWRKFIWTEQRLYASLLATADVVCATALGSATGKIANMIDFPIVFLDEAAMCTEPVSLLPLMKGCEQATLIGDHKQLPAVVQSQIAKRERLHTSLFERLINEEVTKSVLLDTQYRMRPDISAFPNLAFYHSAVQDAESVTLRGRPLVSSYLNATASEGRPPNSTVFLSHSSPEEVFRKSTVNRAEVDMVVSIVGDLLLRNPTLRAADIGVISPYAAQTQLLHEELVSPYHRLAEMRLQSFLGPTRASEVAQVEVKTVDGFQGREKSVIILSTVRSNRAGFIGFLTDRRRLNVALTRAKEALFVLGNPATLEAAVANDWGGADKDAEAGVWRRYLSWLRERGFVRRWPERDHTI